MNKALGLVCFRLRLNIKLSIAHPLHCFRVTMVKETTRLCVQGRDNFHVFCAWSDPGARAACRDGNHPDLTTARISRFSKIRPPVSRFILTSSLLAFSTLP
jgi:hypothetical protein